MTPFTDEDIERWRWVASKHEPTFPIHVLSGEVLAFLSRLEAAEVIAEDHASLYPNDLAVIRWREAAGK